MTTSEYIKFLVIAAGYPKNINVEISKYGIDTMYSVYAETPNYEKTDDYDIDIHDENSEGILKISDMPSLLDLIPICSCGFRETEKEDLKNEISDPYFDYDPNVCNINDVDSLIGVKVIVNIYDNPEL